MSIKDGIENGIEKIGEGLGRIKDWVGDRNNIALSILSATLAALLTGLGLVSAHIAYDEQLYNAVNEDFIAATGLGIEEIPDCYKKTENGKDYLVADVVTRDGTIWSMVWEATGYDYNPSKLYSAKDAAKIAKSEDPISVGKFAIPEGREFN